MLTTGISKKSSNPSTPVCVRCMPVARRPLCPPMTATAWAAYAAFRKLPIGERCCRRFRLFASLHQHQNLPIPFPAFCPFHSSGGSVYLHDICFDAAWRSGPHPAHGVHHQPPMDRRDQFGVRGNTLPAIGQFNFSVWTLARPMAFIFSTPQAIAVLAAGVRSRARQCRRSVRQIIKGVRIHNSLACNR